MAGWKGEDDTVDNQVSTFNTFTFVVTDISQIPAIARFYRTVYGDEEDAKDDANTTITDLEAMSKAASGRGFGEVQESPF